MISRISDTPTLKNPQKCFKSVIKATVACLADALKALTQGGLEGTSFNEA